jgi:hypothetical protein
VYVVAERFLDMQTRNLAIKALYEVICKAGVDGWKISPGPRRINVVYGGTVSAKNPMRKLLIASGLSAGCSDEREEDFKDSPKEFLIELATAALRERYEHGVYQEPVGDLKDYLEE